MTYYNEKYTLHNGKKIYVQYDNHNICRVTKECMEMLLDLHWQGRTEAKEDTNLKDTIKDIHDNVSQEMYCKGIDEFLAKVKEKYPTAKNALYYLTRIADELKAGGNYEN